ncbi:uncharacterized protein TRIADDRAFT_57356 [Trichoplax adhaerens]|uniref:TRPM SLOG domain-containing protein n=1 Tax=Trichoplax adhaerens TaxID=10228 RepID=B3RZ78_TRIAD|nr:hypothetical protein TRIADDRAFT_57356 [Trichoplax adhaerens]EDV23796.1 hypothetical protein TRIADDRAFT_57356 [Trichoplax adhaerens]|eukprot:XP_002113322.1 hypothetical protein TRIADDRAFT_57356 [Trichoplax adhaerens]
MYSKFIDRQSYPYDTYIARSEVIYCSRISENRKSICNYLREFKKKSCQAYKPDKNHTGRNKCTCGLYREDHECIGRFPQQPSDQYVHLPTDAYGSIEFIDQVHGFQNAKYIRLANDTKMDKVARLLRDVWKLIDNKQLPDVILSIGGGVKEYRPNKILEEKFHATLINAAENNNVWLLTCGAFVGVSKNVGEAMFESFFEQWACNDRIKKPNNLKCIGVAPWGYIADSNKLINDPKNNLNPKKYSVNALVERGKPTSLDPYHTHFLLVDDGSHGRYGTEIEFRAMLEAYLTKNLGESDQGEKVQIPTVYVVLEGGPDIFTAVAERLKREVPVIVIEGSGRASSIIAYAVRSCEER